MHIHGKNFERSQCNGTMFLYVLLTQDWAEKEEGGWRRRTEGGDSEWRRSVPDRCVLVAQLNFFYC